MAHMPPFAKAGRAMLWAVAGFGVATIGFGLSRYLLLSWSMLFLCGATDSISVVVRHSLVTLLTPNSMLGRVSAINSLFIGTSNELGGFESGFVAYFFGAVFAVVSGGIGTILVVLWIARKFPEVRRYGSLQAARPDLNEVATTSAKE
jgi:MFS family permease